MNVIRVNSGESTVGLYHARNEIGMLVVRFHGYYRGFGSREIGFYKVDNRVGLWVN